ncbi:ABC transporter permease subunit, partial [Acinetobacter baumannii]
DSLPVLLQGMVLTIKFALSSMGFGLVIGLTVALMGIGDNRLLKAIARVYVSVMRGTPLLVQIFVVYYGLPGIGITMEPTPAGVLTL